MVPIVINVRSQMIPSNIPYSLHAFQLVCILPTCFTYWTPFTNTEKLKPPPWINDHVSNKMWDKITYPFRLYVGNI